jgi:hypothetical protein
VCAHACICVSVCIHNMHLDTSLLLTIGCHIKLFAFLGILFTKPLKLVHNGKLCVAA